LEKLIHKELSYEVVGLCMEVHKILGKGHSEVVYKDALDFEFQEAGIPYSREAQYIIPYKSIILPRKYYADFVIDNKIILEAKATECLTKAHLKVTLNYPAISKLRLGLLANFGEDSLTHQRVVL
jgi:GxxExxY protein